MMLRQCLAIAAATPNLIPIPAAHAPSTDQPVKLQCFRSSYLSKTDARTPQIPIDCSGETEPLPGRDFVPWRFSDACRRSAWVVMQASEKPAHFRTFLNFRSNTLILLARACLAENEGSLSLR